MENRKGNDCGVQRVAKFLDQIANRDGPNKTFGEPDEKKLCFFARAAIRLQTCCISASIQGRVENVVFSEIMPAL